MSDSFAHEPHPANDTGPSPFPSKNVGRRILKNTAVLGVGRNLSALSRLVVVGIVVRGFGADTFAKYALIQTLLIIAEWLLDFGTTEVFVREMTFAPDNRHHLWHVLVGLKLVQIPIAVGALAVILWAMRYPRDIVQAGLLSAVGLFFFAGVVAYRAAFKTALTMEREVVPELLSVMLMIPMVAIVSYLGGGLLGIIVAHVISRAVFFSGCFLLGHRDHPLSFAGVSRDEIGRALRASLVIGAIGFVVAIYTAVDLLMLSSLSALSDIALYSGAQRFTWPLLVALSAVGVAFYPVLAALKTPSPKEFVRTCQRAVDSTLVMGGLALCGMLAGAEFLLSILGQDMVPAADALRVLAVMVAVRAVPAVIGPVLFIVGAQRYALTYMTAALFLKIAIIAVVAPQFGYIGVAYVALGVELLFLAPVSFYFIRRFADYTVQWSVGVRVALIVAIAVYAAQLVLPHGSLAAATLAVSLYVPLAFGARVVRVSELRPLLRKEIA